MLDEAHTILSDLRARLISTQQLMEGYESPLRPYLSKPNSKILDVGSGVGLEAIDLVGQGHTVTAVDDDKSELNKLVKRIAETVPDYHSKLIIEEDQFPDLKKVNYGDYDAIIFYDLLHFFHMSDLESIFKKINEKLNSGTLVSIKVHSYRSSQQYCMDKDKPIFKKFFQFEDLRKLFSSDLFETLLESDIVNTEPEFELDIVRTYYKQAIPTATEKQINDHIKRCSTDFASLYYIVIKK